MNANKKFTFFHRLLHWVLAIALPVSFITGFLRMKWMNKHTIVDLIAAKTEHGVLSEEQMTGIAKAIREPMWEWHVVAAKVIIFTFIARIVYMLVKGVHFPKPFAANITVKERLQGLSYVYFYLFVFVQAVTGICLHHHLLVEWKNNIEAVHKWGLYLFPIFILLHFIGVMMAEYSNRKGITSKMIAGD